MPMLVKEWRRSKTSNFECVQQNPPSKDLSVFECEYIVVALLLQQLIATDCQYTAYDLVVYLRCTSRAEQFLTSPKASFTIRLPPAVQKQSIGNEITHATTTDTNEWIATKKAPAVKRKPSTSTTKSKTAKKTAKTPTVAKKVKKLANSKKKKSTVATKKSPSKRTMTGVIARIAKEPEVIDVEDDSSSAEVTTSHHTVVRRPTPLFEDNAEDDLMKDTDEEYEFDG